MAELSPEAQRLLAQLQGVDDPTPAERSSGEAAVQQMLAAHGMELPQLPPAAHRVAARSGAAFKLAWLLGAALFAAMGWLGVDAWRSSSTATRSVALEPASPSPVRSSEVTPAERVAEPVVQPQPELRKTPEQPSAKRTQSKSAEDSLAAELRFLSSVDAEIRAGAHERALRMLQQRKSTAILQEERAAMRVLALCGRDLDAHAARERDSFLKSHPSSVLSARVRSACTGAPSP